MVYEDIFDAKNACDHLSGFNVCNRYLVVLYYQPNKVSGSGPQLLIVYSSLQSFHVFNNKDNKKTSIGNPSSEEHQNKRVRQLQNQC